MKMIIKLNPMKALFLLLLFGLTSCYVYKPYTGIEVDTNTNSNSMRSIKATSLSDRETQSGRMKGPEGPGKSLDAGVAKSQAKKESEKSKEEPKFGFVQSSEMQKEKELEIKKEKEFAEMRANDGNTLDPKSGKANPNEMGLKQKIKANKYYKISVAEKQYKIQADQWEGDTLVSHILRQPKKVLRFHENQIDEEELLERRFSKSYSDIFTVGSYVGVGAAILLFLL